MNNQDKKNIKNNTSLAIFETHKIRRHFDEKTETWYFSVIDIVAALTEQNDFQVARSYWKKLAQRLRDEGSQVVTKCHRLKMVAQIHLRRKALRLRRDKEGLCGGAVKMLN